MCAYQHIVPPGSGSSQGFMPGEVFTWKLAGADGGLDFAELSLASGVQVPEHIHAHHDETYYVLDGGYRFKVGDEIADVAAGSFVWIPRGTPHTWTNLGQAAGRMLVIFTPGGMKGYFDDLQHLLPELMLGIEDITRVPADVLHEAQIIMDRYGYQLVGPPLSNERDPRP